MNNSNYRLTFILPIKDKAGYSVSWLKNNIRKKYKYHVADGSIGDENRKIFESAGLKNLNYRFYGEDDTINKYLRKVLAAIESCDTEYVMLCDNDDFINFEGIEECIKVLDHNQEFTCSGGILYKIFENKQLPGYYTLPIPYINPKSVHNVSDGYEAFKVIRRQYQHLWYAVYRKEAIKEIYSKMIETGISDLFLLEILQVDLALILGKYCHIKFNHYIRMMNPVSSTARSLGENYHNRIFFDWKYREELNKLNIYYAELLGHGLNEIQDEQQNFYLWYFRQEPRVKNGFTRKIHAVVIRFPFFRIKIIFLILNGYLKGKNIGR